MSDASSHISQLAVSLYGLPVGIIAQFPDQRIIFSFDPAYESDGQRPTLSLNFKTASGALRQLAATRVRLPPFFSNLLPEGHLRDYLAARGGVKPIREFPLLALLGADLPGAVEVHAEGDDTYNAHASGTDEQAASQALHFSLAGVQLKFSALAEANGGLTIAVSGTGGDWIVKLPSVRFAAVPEHEHVMLDLASAIGITVPAHKMTSLDAIEGLPDDLGPIGGRALAVKRFDRGACGSRIHIEDFAQVFGRYPEDKYRAASSENVARVLWAEAGLDDSLEFVRRLVFVVLTGNADMHLKNWSVMYEEKASARLSPAYDLVGTVAFLPQADLALKLGGESMMQRVTMDAFRSFAAKVGLPVAAVEGTVEETVRRFREAWQGHPSLAMLPADQRSTLDRHARSLPLWKLATR